MPATPEHGGSAVLDPDLVAWLEQPSSYPHPCESVELVPTHTSLVALAGDHAYKLRRPVKFSYVDLSTLHRRHDDCLREVELNRRLAPGVHLGVPAITRENNGFAWNGLGPAVEYAVQMRRLPADRKLSSLLERGQISEDDIHELCDVLIDFYWMVARSDEITEAAMPDALERLLDDSLADAEQIRVDGVPRDFVAMISAALRQYLHDHRKLFIDRALGGAVVDGHGDLRAEHIYLLDPPVIIGRLRFNDQRRYVDIAFDVALLMNDLVAARRTDLAIAARARLHTIKPTDGFRSALIFYRVLRSWMRAKVAATAAAAHDVSEPERSRWRERASFELSFAVVMACGLNAPKVVAVCGLPGSGKSTVAAVLAERLGFIWLSSDQIRNELGFTQLAGGADLYGGAMTRRTYRELLKRTEAAVRDSRSVVVDATFGSRKQRNRIRKLARRRSAPFVLIECVCPNDVLRERLTHRTGVSDAASDAAIAQLAEMQSHFESVDELPAELHVRVDTSQPKAAVSSAVLLSV